MLTEIPASFETFELPFMSKAVHLIMCFSALDPRPVCRVKKGIGIQKMCLQTIAGDVFFAL